MSKHAVERPRHLREIERLYEQARVSDLPAAAAAHEATKLLLNRPALPRRLLLESAEGSKLSLTVDDLFHAAGAEGADQLVLQVCDADVETESLHLGAGEVGAESGPLEAAPELCLLCGVTEARQSEVEPLRAEHLEEASDALRATNRHDGDALGPEVPATASSQRLQCVLVARPFDEYDRTCGGRVVRRSAELVVMHPREPSGRLQRRGREWNVSLTQYYTATTLDGFIADSDNSLDWLFTRKREQDGLLNYGEFIAGVGAMAMGSTTYEWILDHEFADRDPAEWKWPYDIPCWVFTHRQLPIVPESRVEFTSADVVAVHQEMVGAAGGRNVWIVGGGDLAGQFADVGLLDEVIVWIAPVTLGAGAPLLPRRIELRLEELARNGDFGCARFSVVRPPA
jgi:dihydrofolate reductase